ncbi:MAG: GGDEF domain-containing protein [Planctomycetota bacterium]
MWIQSTVPLTPVLSAALLSVVLLAVGVAIGYRWGRNTQTLSAESLKQTEREQLLRLLQGLAKWMNEYSGNVTDYQKDLVEIHSALRNDANDPETNRMMVLLRQIMDKNAELQSRLDVAEKQLQTQTEQLESYLTEARTDGLTGLLNRRAFDRAVEDAFESFRQGGTGLSIALVDIDKFKSINDTYGHQVGDEVLRSVAVALRRELNTAKMVARFGGEEFAALFEGPVREASQKLSDARREIASNPINVAGDEVTVTISVGLAQSGEDLVVAPVIRRADEALYAAKKRGRNRVYFHESGAPVLFGAPEVVSDNSR